MKPKTSTSNGIQWTFPPPLDGHPAIRSVCLGIKNSCFPSTLVSNGTVKSDDYSNNKRPFHMTLTIFTRGNLTSATDIMQSQKSWVSPLTTHNLPQNGRGSMYGTPARQLSGHTVV